MSSTTQPTAAAAGGDDGEEEEELLKEQRLFKNSGQMPAAQVRRPSQPHVGSPGVDATKQRQKFVEQQQHVAGPIPTSTASVAGEKSAGAPPPPTVMAPPLGLALGEIVEHCFDGGNSTNGGGNAVYVMPTLKPNAGGLPRKEKGTGLGRSFARRRPKPAPISGPEDVHGPPTQVPQSESASEDVVRGAAVMDMSGISQQNEQRLATMSPEQIAQAQQELQNKLTPAQMQFFLKRRQERLQTAAQPAAAAGAEVPVEAEATKPTEAQQQPAPLVGSWQKGVTDEYSSSRQCPSSTSDGLRFDMQGRLLLQPLTAEAIDVSEDEAAGSFQQTHNRHMNDLDDADGARIAPLQRDQLRSGNEAPAFICCMQTK